MISIRKDSMNNESILNQRQKALKRRITEMLKSKCGFDFFEFQVKMLYAQGLPYEIESLENDSINWINRQITIYLSDLLQYDHEATIPLEKDDCTEAKEAMHAIKAKMKNLGFLERQKQAWMKVVARKEELTIHKSLQNGLIVEFLYNHKTKIVTICTSPIV